MKLKLSLLMPMVLIEIGERFGTLNIFSENIGTSTGIIVMPSNTLQTETQFFISTTHTSTKSTSPFLGYSVFLSGKNVFFTTSGHSIEISNSSLRLSFGLASPTANQMFEVNSKDTSYSTLI